MTATMQTLSVTGIAQLDLLDAPIPTPADHEVLIKVAYCGICGSDFPRYFDGGVHNFPQVLGHEFSGTVTAVGAAVTDVAEGDRVAVAPLVPCGDCAACSKGRPALCPNYSFIGSRQQGALAEYVAVPARNCVPVPAGVSLREAALVEPLTIALHGLARTTIPVGVDAAVFGAGVIGLLTTAVLKSMGAKRVTCVDISESKLELARQFGATDTIVNTGSAVADFFAETGKPELCLELAGFPQTQVQAITSCAKDGTVVLVGTGHGDVTFTPQEFETILRGELTVTGAWMSYSAPFPGREWSTALDLIASGAVDVASLVSREYSLADTAAPFHDVRAARGDLLKVLYRVNGDED